MRDSMTDESDRVSSLTKDGNGVLQDVNSSRHGITTIPETDAGIAHLACRPESEARAAPWAFPMRAVLLQLRRLARAAQCVPAIR